MLYSLFYLLSRVLGLVRNQMMLAVFGVSANALILDAYFAAFKIPDFLFNIISIGTIGTVFIPLFTRYNKESIEKAKKFTGDMLLLFALIFSFLCMVGWLFLDQIVWVIAPGFEVEKLALVSDLSQIMILAPLFFAISSVLGALCNIERKILNMAIAPVLYNLGIIFGIVVLVPSIGIYGVAWGVVFGSILHMLSQLIGVRDYIRGVKFGYRGLWNPEIGHALKISLPRIIAIVSLQIMVVLEAVFASYLDSGSVAHFNIADNLGNLPVGMVGITLSVLGFPMLATLAVDGKLGDLNKFLHRNFDLIGLMMIPLSVLTLFYSKEIIGLIFVHGKFSVEDLHIVWLVLVYFALSFLPQSLIPIISKTYYSFEDTYTPMWIALFIIFLNLGLLYSFVFLLGLGIISLSLAYSICVWIQFFLLSYYLMKKGVSIFTPMLKYIDYILVTLILSVFTYLPLYLGVVGLGWLWSLILSLVFVGVYVGIYRKVLFVKGE